MMFLQLVLICIIIPVGYAENLKFPPWFKFGSATSAYQIEGAWNSSDKSENVWDHFTHTKPHVIVDHSNGDETCNSYEFWRQDIDLISDLGLHFYRFSISWSRLLPTAFSNHISEDGKNYYNNIIDELLARGIEPIVTLYHWDLPQNLQEYGGWINPLMTDWFADYAEVAYKLFGDRVKIWITVNEPLIACDVAFNTGSLAPGVTDPDKANYLCSKHMLIGHAKAWRIYDKYYKRKYQGKVSLANHLIWFESEDAEVADLANQYGIGRFSHPVYSKKGGWPPSIEKAVAEKSKRQGYHRSRLPKFSQQEVELVKGTYDFYGINYYAGRYVRKAKTKERIGTWPMDGLPDLNTVLESHSYGGAGNSDVFPVRPEDLRSLLKWLKLNYGDIEFFITENGFGNDDIGLNDYQRTSYIEKHLEQILLSIREDHVNVTGYTYWALMDNFEWADGYTKKYGLHAVDFNSPNKTRIPRNSAQYLKRVIRSHSLNVTYDADENIHINTTKVN